MPPLTVAVLQHVTCYCGRCVSPLAVAVLQLAACYCGVLLQCSSACCVSPRSLQCVAAFRVLLIGQAVRRMGRFSLLARAPLAACCCWPPHVQVLCCWLPHVHFCVTALVGAVSRYVPRSCICRALLPVGACRVDKQVDPCRGAALCLRRKCSSWSISSRPGGRG